MLQQIETFRIVPHPQNPRKELGDLTELSESIKSNGILQNLTVVETETAGVYRVIIGHRRLQAAMKAGMESVPCAVVEMDEQTQLSTMLLENMQRSDLTMFEQAQGIQQCMDFGMTVDDISSKTGFSKTTVRRRVKMLELDQDKVKKAVNATLDDYIALEKVKNIDKRNELIAYIGTNNFNLEVEKAIQSEKPVSDEKPAYDHTEEDSQKQEITTEQIKKELEIIKLSKNLRINFIKEVFKRKINGQEVALSVGVINEMIINGDNNKFDHGIFNQIVNPTGIDKFSLNEKMLKHRPNFLIVAAFAYLESKLDKKEVYDFLTQLEYVISDDEKEMLENDQN